VDATQQPTAAPQAPTVLVPAAVGPSSADAGGQFWVGADFVMAWFRGQNVPPLVTTSPAGTAQTSAGILGQPTTGTLFGGALNEQMRYGFRLGAGYWFTPQKDFGVEVGFSMLESQASTFGFTSDGTTILARPFTDANTGLPQAQLVAFPGNSSGSVFGRVGSGNLYEAHIDFVERITDTPFAQLDGLVGYRFYRYDEGLSVQQNVLPTGPDFAPGTQIVTSDGFNTTNEFHGVDLGLRTRFCWESLTVTLLGKIAVGHLDQRVNINGNTVTSVPGASSVVQNGGLFALSSNIGTHDRHEWTTMPEIGINLNWQLNPNVQVRLGYSVLFLEHVGRVGDQVPNVINPNLLPNSTTAGTGPNSPTFSFIHNDISIQSINLGLIFSF
jgi:hypothetical protein